MKRKPHIKLVACRAVFPNLSPAYQNEPGLWCLFSSREGRRPVAISRDREKIFRLAAKRWRAPRCRWHKSTGCAKPGPCLAPHCDK